MFQWLECLQPLTKTTYDTSTLQLLDLKDAATKVQIDGDTELFCAWVSVPFELTGGHFRLELFLPADYPMAPPKVRFLTKMYWMVYFFKSVDIHDSYIISGITQTLTSWVASAWISWKINGPPHCKSALCCSVSRLFFQLLIQTIPLITMLQNIGRQTSLKLWVQPRNGHQSMPLHKPKAMP